jgi:hypothetical protein
MGATIARPTPGRRRGTVCNRLAGTSVPSAKQPGLAGRKPEVVRFAVRGLLRAAEQLGFSAGEVHVEHTGT